MAILDGDRLNLMKTLFRSCILLTGLLLPLNNLLQAQTSLALSSATVPPGGTTALTLSLSRSEDAFQKLYTPHRPLVAVEQSLAGPDQLSAFLCDGTPRRHHRTHPLSLLASIQPTGGHSVDVQLSRHERGKLDRGCRARIVFGG